MLTLDPKDLPIPLLHQYLIGSVGPRPICFASTIDLQGNCNLAPFSFFNVFSANPPILVFAPNNSGRTGQPKDTLLNVKEVPEVVINVVSASMVEQMNVAAAPWTKGINEFEKSGFTPLKSEIVKPFRVAESPSQMECKVLEVKEMGIGGGAGNLVICEVVKIHIRTEVLDADEKIDQRKMHLVGRLGGSWYSRTDEDALFQLAQPMSATVGYDGLPAYIRSSTNLTANDIGSLACLDRLPDDADLEKIKEHRIRGREWDQIRGYFEQGEAFNALCLLKLIHE
jgi:flavin reductase (DIM6/NTAB) family NADH-FMN oxidoreductase RutF